MPSDFETRLSTFAQVIIRVGLNLQRGQRLLIAEPYELQGVARSAEIIVERLKTVAGCEVEIIWGDGARLREFAGQKNWRGFAKLVAANARAMENYVREGDALLFLQGYQAKLMTGIAPESIAESRRIGWEHFGPIAQQLISGATNWMVAPAPAPGWANVVYADRPSEQRLAALWEDVFASMRIPRPGATSRHAGENSAGSSSGAWAKEEGRDFLKSDPLAAWSAHLQSLQDRRDDLNSQRLRTLHFHGEGTDLTVGLAPEHVWCSACLTTRFGLPFVANLPTEEVFTAPQKDSAEGTVRVTRPINYGGAIIEGIELVFRRGRVVQARARTGNDLLRQLLDTDEGAGLLGEVALVPHETTLARSGRLFRHPLLDENSANHIALGEAYGFCLRSPAPGALNRSLVHVDLPMAARVTMTRAEPA